MWFPSQQDRSALFDVLSLVVIGIDHLYGAVPDGSTNHDSTDRKRGQFLFYHDVNFTKSKENLHFRLLVPLFVPISVCVTTQDDATACDVTIGMWRHNQ